MYGLWGTLLVAYGIVFSTAIDLLGKRRPLANRGNLSMCKQPGVLWVWCIALLPLPEVCSKRRSERKPDSVLHHQCCWKVRSWH